jgi:MscS family membrane protein
MKLKFENWFRIFVFLLAIFLTWTVWRATAQTNLPIAIVAPGNEQRFNPGTIIPVQINSTVPDAKRVEFVADGQVVMVVSSNVAPPYSLIWSNISAGTHRVAARVLRENGQTIESPSIIVRVYYAALTFGLDNFEVLRHNALFGIPLWQYCASLIYIFLAFYVSKILDYLTRVWLKKWAEKTETQFDDLLLDLLNGPIKIIAFVIFLRVGLEVFSWPALVQNFLTKGFTIVVAATLTYTILKFVDLVLGYWRHRNKTKDSDVAFDEQLFPIIRKSLKVFVVIVATLVTLDNIGVNITAAIASLSIGGLAVGLAAQDTLANLFGAIAVFMDKPFRIGDRIQFGDVDGTVENIGLRSTRVRNLDGHLVTVPNKTMGNASITNITRRPNIKTVMNIGLTYDTSTEKLRRALKILEETYRNDPLTCDLIVSFNKFADSALNILVVHWWNSQDAKAHLKAMQEMNLKIKEQFEAEGIEFAFPTQTLYVKTTGASAAR